MNSRPTISVIIPTYNRAPLLERLLKQLHAQSAPPEQVIVVDDHSSDSTFNIVNHLATTWPQLQYVKNKGHHQRDAKATGLQLATSEYIGFFDDDAVIEDQQFFASLRPLLVSDHVIQAKIILEQMGYRNLPNLSWRDYFATRPYPILELITTSLHRGTTPRTMFPLIEWGNFWPRHLAPLFIDRTLINDGYGESYGTSLRLREHGIQLQLHPDLLIRHPGASSGGSHKFNKQTMVTNFTPFHEGYFYNMIYLHARYWRNWVWLWLPYFILKSLLALALNHNLQGWRQYAWQPLWRSLSEHYARRA